MSAAPGPSDADRERLLVVLERSRQLGFLGPGPVDAHLDHSAVFVAAWEAARPGTVPASVLDLGSGGGVPGLILAFFWLDAEVLLLDSMVRRTSFLEEAVADLSLSDRVSVVTARAEDAGRTSQRGRFDLVVARSFAAAPVTAECAAPLVKVGGLVAVAEPPESGPDRWPDKPLASLGLRRGPRIDEPFHVQVLEQVGPVPDRYPRKVGVPGKRPLWDEHRHQPRSE